MEKLHMHWTDFRLGNIEMRMKESPSKLNNIGASLTFTTTWANSADDKLMIVFLFFPENRI